MTCILGLKSHLTRLLLLAMTCLVSAGTASAQTATWTGAISNFWNNTGNWTGTAPTDNSSVALVFGAIGAQNTGAGNVNILSNLTATSVTFNGNSNYNINGQSFTLGGNVSNTGGSNIIGMNVALSATRTFDITGGNLAINGLLSGTGGVTKTGATTLAFNANNSYTGATTLNDGFLQVSGLANGDNNSSIGASSAAAANLVLNGGTLLKLSTGSGTTNRLFTLGQGGGALNAADAVFNFTGTGMIAIPNDADINRVLTLRAETGVSTFSPQLVDGVSARTVSLIKNGSATWVLTNANTYSGGTSVSRGTLLVNNTSGSGTGTGPTTVASGATIGGTGTLGGSLTINNGATLSPGNSNIGTLNASAGTTEWAGGGRLQVQYDHSSGAPLNAGSTIDLYNSAGSLNLSASTGTPFVIDLQFLGNPNVALRTPQSVRIATFTAGGFGTFTDPAQFTFTGDFVGTSPTVTVDGNNLMLTFTPVPEPATILGLAAVLGFGGFARRRLRGTTPAVA